MSAGESEQLGLELDAPALPDADARRRIAEQLGTNLLVEAGAGSGKTTALVSRMVALVKGGAAEVTEIAAVTFTRKAAGELRERFQEALETERGRAGLSPEVRARLERALQDLDRAFMGTIHAFCARLLRERPLEAGIDPGFVETTAPEATRLAARFWNLHLERLAAAGDPVFGDLEDVGLTPADLRGLYDTLRENLDVTYPLETAPPPDPARVSAVRDEVDALLDQAFRIMPRDEPEGGWDDLQRRLRSVRYVRDFRPWTDDRVFLDALAELCSRQEWKIVQKRWAADAAGKEAAKRVCERANRLLSGDGPRLLSDWWAHRYPIAMRFALGAAKALERHRRRGGHLDFQDLLSLAAGLLRRSATARTALGRRWKRLLVDEFQDTDPLQAEVLFLLASDPEEDGGDWTRAEPRPGALFVVGDPKQSIYRFRRADIALYAQVRGRFRARGEVVSLVANFRSGDAVAAIVNDVFGPPDGFPDEGHAAQAAFAPMVPQPRAAPAPREGVFHYTVPQGERSRDALARWSASALADWIARRVGPGGDRRPGDFLILTRQKAHLEPYARALEARNLPVRVSGAGVGVEDEIAELSLLLEALIDPADASRTVAVLIGPFFGVDHEQLLAHREAGRGFDFRVARVEGRGTGGGEGDAGGGGDDAGGAGDGADAEAAAAGGHAADADVVEAALARMRAWWTLARTQPADVVIGRIASDVGLLPWAASGELGQVRAGALAYALDAVRAAGLAGDTSLTGALEALAVATMDEEAEAPLEPGRSDTIRLMNLHKAKGLEADVVVLAAPYGEWEPRVDAHVERAEGGRARGWLSVERRDGRSRRTLAQPAGWAEKEAAERVFSAAEDLRLLYVAGTRAAHELVIARNGAYPAKSPWSLFEAWLDARAAAGRLDVAPVDPPARERLEVPAETLAAQIREAEATRVAAARPTFAFQSVTQVAKGAEGAADAADESAPAGATPAAPPAEPPADEDAAPGGEARMASPGGVEALDLAASDGPGGYEWGSAVHGVLEAAARGASGERLRAVGRTLLLELDRPFADGEPVELDALMSTAETVLSHPLWERARAAERVAAETPFVLEWGGSAAAEGPPGEGDEPAPTYLEGVIDLAFREADGWVVVDYKTDRGDDPDFAGRRGRYRTQLRAYADAWERLTGERVKERLLWFVRAGVVEAVRGAEDQG